MKEENNEAKQDLTAFWLEWKDTCAIALCRDHGRERVIAGANKLFTKLIANPRKPTSLSSSKGDEGGEFSDEGMSDLSGSIERPSNRPESITEDYNDWAWKSAGDAEATPHVQQKLTARGYAVSEYLEYVRDFGKKGVPNAFEILESHLYVKEGESRRKPSAGNKVFNGKGFKNYLFEDIATRPGGMSKNLWGYLIRGVLRTIANESFGTPVAAPIKGEEGEEIELNPEDLPGIEDIWGEKEKTAFAADVEAAKELFREKLFRQWPELDMAAKVAFACQAFDLSMNSPEIKKMVGVGGSALYNRRELLVKMLRDVVAEGHVEREVLGEALRCGMLTNAVYEAVSADPACGALKDFIDAGRQRSGKNKTL